MKIPAVHKILEFVEAQSTKAKKIEALRVHAPNKVLLQLLKYTFDPNIKFDLPEGNPPYKELDANIDESGTGLYKEARRLYIFVEGGSPNLQKIRRETLFIQLLESIHPKDAKVVLGVKDKKLPYKGITKKLIEEAFPALL